MSFVMSVRPSVRMEQLDSTGRILMKFGIWNLSVGKILSFIKIRRE